MKCRLPNSSITWSLAPQARSKRRAISEQEMDSLAHVGFSKRSGPRGVLDGQALQWTGADPSSCPSPTPARLPPQYGERGEQTGIRARQKVSERQTQGVG